MARTLEHRDPESSMEKSISQPEGSGKVEILRERKNESHGPQDPVSFSISFSVTL